MTTEALNDRINELGAALLSDGEVRERDWDGLSFVYTFAGGSRGQTGYLFRADGGFEPTLPDDPDGEILELVTGIRQAMATETGESWHQCLVQLWRPGPQMKIQFEYDDPERWRPRITGLDMSGFAGSIRPPMDGG